MLGKIAIFVSILEQWVSELITTWQRPVDIDSDDNSILDGAASVK